MNANPSIIDDLVIANHILVNEGVLDGFGHISVRNDLEPGRFLIARSMAPGLVHLEDIVEVDLSGNVHDAQGRRCGVVGPRLIGALPCQLDRAREVLSDRPVGAPRRRCQRGRVLHQAHVELGYR